MALSMDEQRILDQIERGLASADPALATRMASFGANRGISALRMRRLRLVASVMTLLVVASVSLVVYALVPFRAVTDRHAGGKASSPAHPVMTAPSHPGHSSPQASAGQAGQCGAGQCGTGQCRARQRHPGPRDLSRRGLGGQPGSQHPRGRLGQPGLRAAAAAPHARPVGRAPRRSVLAPERQYSRQNCSRYCSRPSRFFLACWNSSLSGSTPRSNMSSYSRWTSRRLRA